MQKIFDKKLLMLKPEDLTVSNTQPRKFFDQYELDKLADSIATNGIIQPLAVRKLPDGKFEIIAGERRFRAAKQVGLRRIPCVIHTVDEQTCAVISLTENIQRSNLSIFEEAMALDRLINYYGISQSEAAIKLGMAQSTLSNKLRLLNLPEKLRERITKARLTERHARALLRLPESKREAVLNYIIANGLTLSQTEKYIDDMLLEKPAVPESAKPLRKQAIGDVRLFYNSLSKLVCTLQSAGINAKTRKTETEKYIEYKVRIKKADTKKEDCEQLKIC